MTLVVPFDGSDLSKVALVRAVQFDTVVDEGVVAVSVVPQENVKYAREKGWLGSNESFDIDQITTYLRDSVKNIGSDAGFNCILVGRWAQSGTIAKKIRRFARDTDATIVFIGSENAGRLIQSISVGSTVATDRTYDTMVISDVEPTRIEKFEEAIPTEERIN